MEFHSSIHWFWVAAFFSLGIVFIALRDRIGNAREMCRLIRIDARDEADQCQERLASAVARRVEAEGQAAEIGPWIGAASFVLCLLAVFTNLSDGFLYSLLCLVIVIVSAIAYLRLRNTHGKRAAMLNARNAGRTLSILWFGAGAVSALSPLAFVGTPWTGLALIVCASALLTCFIGWRLAHLPSILSGEDISAEQLVDDRLRTYRTSAVLSLAFIQPFVFASQIMPRTSVLEEIAYFVPWAGFMAFMVWQLRMQRQPVTLQ